jgi:simple sugar transport system permease protein
VETFVNSTVVLGTPLLFAAIGGLIAERAGVLNIGLEGFVLLGAFVSAWIAGGDGPVLLGLVVAVVASLVVGVLYGLIVVHLRADQVAVGIAFNLLILGLTGYGYDLIVKAQGPGGLETGSIANVGVPGLEAIPWVGPVFDQPWLSYVGYALVPIVFFVLFRTGLGVRARACGEYSEGARAAGLNIKRWRLGATAISGMIAGMAGAFLVLADTHGFLVNMSSGKGYIALAVIILGRWSPIGAVGAALLFGAAQAANYQLQVGSIFGLEPPTALVQTLPYVVTIVAVSIVGRRVVAPAEDGRPLAVP